MDAKNTESGNGDSIRYDTSTSFPRDNTPQLRLWVPTYFGHRNCELGVEENEEFDNPHVPVLVHSADGIRLILGSHDYEDCHAPDVQIERRPKGWAIFLQPSGGDSSGFVYFLDDDRSFLVKENGSGAIELIDNVDEIPELDDLPSEDDRTRTCARCTQSTEYSGDWYGDLCPSCADATDGDWICTVCGQTGSFEEMGGDGTANPECCDHECKFLGYEDHHT